MDGEKLLLLEKAARDLMSPPYAVTEVKRREAEAIFMELKKARMPYDSCKFILENSSSDYVLFQAGSTVRDAVVREWEVLSVEERGALRGYLLHYITSRPDLVSYVREQLLQTVALMVKRATLEGNRRSLFDSVFTTVSQLLMMDHKMKQLGCSLLSALLTEYANSSGASNIGLPIEFHVKCKIAIQEEELLRVLLFTVQYLRQYTSVDLQSLPHDHLSLLSDLLSLLSKVLNWDFQLGKFSPVPLNISDVTTVILRPPRSYAATFLDPSFLELLFSLLGRVWCNGELLHHLVQGLTQLASVTKPVLGADEERKVFLGSFVSGVLGYVATRSDITRQEVYGLSCILRRLATNFSPAHFASLPPGQLSLLVTTLTQLTTLTAHRSVENEGSEESLMYVEALDHYLEVFVNLLQDQTSLPPSLLSHPATEVFNSYLESKMAAPRGWRSDQWEEGEIFELEEDDREAFSDQLRSVGCIARSIPEHSLPLLLKTLGESTSSCMGSLESIRRDPEALYSRQNSLDSTYEDLHWLVLISAFTLCDIVKGEEVLIPANLMNYSVQRHKEAGQGAELPGDISTLVWRERGDQVDLSSSLDPILALFLSLCRLCVVERVFITAGLVGVVSPQLSSTLVWCLSQVVHPYIHLAEDSYDQVSLPLLSVFGKDTPSSHWLCAFLLDKVTFNLSVWSGEESVAVDTVKLLASLVKNRARAAVIVKCELLWSLMRGFASGGEEVAALPPRAQRDLVCSLLQCGVGDTRQQFLTELLQPIRQRFCSLVERPDLREAGQEWETEHQMLCLLEAICGLAFNSRPALIQEFFEFLLPLLQASVPLLEVFRDNAEVVRLIIELFALTAENYIIFLNQEHTLEVYKVCLDLIRSYAGSNAGRYRGTGLDLEEEEACEDLLHFLKMLTHLTVKDFLDFGSADGEKDSVKPVDVVITGLNTILPLMTEEILKFPTLCRQFYTLLNYVCENFPSNLSTIPEQLFLTCMTLLEAGLHSYGPEVRGLCLESIEGVASCHHAREEPSQALKDILEHFLKVIFELMLSASFEMDTIHYTSGAVYAIICSHKEGYLSLANTLVSSQTDPLNQTRLMEAFSLLTPPSLPLDSKKTSKITFRKNLEQFLPFVKGFLCYR